ncbi:hypothetical protein A4D02_07025 [Niastella koreensis]|uniref:Uncharacterized protein n=1 Tax=Niastella koreensis TaxID=354356 RepID=A0ABX3NW32_9BACT|nr:hypothetical protein A4D02_07025 [Niastella koreensis]
MSCIDCWFIVLLQVTGYRLQSLPRLVGGTLITVTYKTHTSQSETWNLRPGTWNWLLAALYKKSPRLKY